MCYRINDIVPTRTYATRENALKAVGRKFVGATDGDEILFSVAILLTPEGRFFPLLYNINKDNRAFQLAVWSGFNCVN